MFESDVELEGAGVSVTVSCESFPSWSISVMDSVLIHFGLLALSAAA